MDGLIDGMTEGRAVGTTEGEVGIDDGATDGTILGLPVLIQNTNKQTYTYIGNGLDTETQQLHDNALSHRHKYKLSYDIVPHISGYLHMVAAEYSAHKYNAPDGISDGMPEGRDEGSTDGMSEGRDEGSTVGKLLGAPITHSIHTRDTRNMHYTLLATTNTSDITRVQLSSSHTDLMDMWMVSLTA